MQKLFAGSAAGRGRHGPSSTNGFRYGGGDRKRACPGVAARQGWTREARKNTPPLFFRVKNSNGESSPPNNLLIIVRMFSEHSMSDHLAAGRGDRSTLLPSNSVAKTLSRSIGWPRRENTSYSPLAKRFRGESLDERDAYPAECDGRNERRQPETGTETLGRVQRSEEDDGSGNEDSHADGQSCEEDEKKDIDKIDEEEPDDVVEQSQSEHSKGGGVGKGCVMCKKRIGSSSDGTTGGSGEKPFGFPRSQPVCARAPTKLFSCDL